MSKFKIEFDASGKKYYEAVLLINGHTVPYKEVKINCVVSIDGKDKVIEVNAESDGYITAEISSESKTDLFQEEL